MSNFTNRVLIGGAAACVAGLIGGPVLAAVVWKGVGFAVTGNPLHLIPGGGLIADGTDAVGAMSDIASAASDVGDLAGQATDIHGGAIHSIAEHADSAGPDIWGNQGNVDIHQNPPMNGQGVEMGQLGNGQYPTDIHSGRV